MTYDPLLIAVFHKSLAFSVVIRLLIYLNFINVAFTDLFDVVKIGMKIQYKQLSYWTINNSIILTVLLRSLN